MSQRIDQSDTFCFDCVYMYHYTVKSCSHTICHSCFRKVIEQKIRLQQETIICPRCPDSEKRRNRLRMMAEKNHIREQHKVESVSRKQLSPLQLILKYDCKNIAPRIDESIQDITDLNERKRVQKILWKTIVQRSYQFNGKLRTNKNATDSTNNLNLDEKVYVLSDRFLIKYWFHLRRQHYIYTT
jgi:hypothetical protein